MLYSENDKALVKKQLTRGLLITLLLTLIPSIPSIILVYTARIRWLSIVFSILGGAAAIFYFGMYVQPIISYLRYLNEIFGGRNHEFTGELTEIAQDSVREGVPCKTLFFADDAGDMQRLCYYDQIKYEKGCVTVGGRYHVTVHGQSIIAIASE